MFGNIAFTHKCKHSSNWSSMLTFRPFKWASLTLLKSAIGVPFGKSCLEPLVVVARRWIIYIYCTWIIDVVGLLNKFFGIRHENAFHFVWLELQSSLTDLRLTQRASWKAEPAATRNFCGFLYPKATARAGSTLQHRPAFRPLSRWHVSTPRRLTRLLYK